MGPSGCQGKTKARICDDLRRRSFLGVIFDFPCGAGLPARWGARLRSSSLQLSNHAGFTPICCLAGYILASSICLNLADANPKTLGFAPGGRLGPLG